MRPRDILAALAALLLLLLYADRQAADADSAERDRAAQYAKDDLATIADQALRNLRAGHRPAHALRLALLTAEITKLNRRIR